MELHPSECPGCNRVKVAQRDWFSVRYIVPVRTWCRKCGMPVLLAIKRDYAAATTFLYGLDDQPMAHHPGHHAENGGWGKHWRFDEVLMMVFPEEHMEATSVSGEYWPIPPWYEFNLAMEKAVSIISPAQARDVARYVDQPRDDIGQMLDRNPMSREELEKNVGQVWDEDEFNADFEILGYRAPYAMVVAKHNNTQGTLVYQNYPRYYFNFQVDRVI